MYVFPRAGSPTMEMTVGLLMTLGHDAEKKKKPIIYIKNQKRQLLKVVNVCSLLSSYLPLMKYTDLGIKSKFYSWPSLQRTIFANLVWLIFVRRFYSRQVFFKNLAIFLAIIHVYSLISPPWKRVWSSFEQTLIHF